MKYFLKLNVVCILYAIMIFVPIELMVNVYRISRVTSWEVDTVNIFTSVTLIVDIIVGTILQLFLAKKWLDDRKANFWAIILWVPYFVLSIYVFASLFPITYGGDAPNPATGLLVIGGLVLYPFYILTLTLFDMTIDERTIKTA